MAEDSLAEAQNDPNAVVTPDESPSTAEVQADAEPTYDATEAAVEKAAELGVSLETLEGSGKDGRITVSDVEAAAPAPVEGPQPFAVILNPAVFGENAGTQHVAVAGYEDIELHASDPVEVDHYHGLALENAYVAVRAE